MPHLFCFGLGYSAKVFAKRLLHKGWTLSGTSRTEEGLSRLEEMGFQGILFDGEQQSDVVSDAISQASHILCSIAPSAGLDPALKFHKNDLQSKTFDWIGYLSTVGVYGNWDGAWVDETSETRPKSERSKNRVVAENEWLELARNNNLPIHIFRIAGIYGPGRNPIKTLKEGRGRRLNKPGQVFNRIHVDDIANVLEASVASPNPGAIYNVTDNEPAPPQDVVSYAAQLLAIDPPPLIPFEEANLTPMARSFYGENKRVRNSRIIDELGVSLSYPTYREGLQAILRSNS
ncbi:MAG: SDR family oxidoreductase [Pseudomonadota bacterium]